MNALAWTAMAPAWGLFLVEVALKSSLLIAGLLLADRMLGERRASWRNLLWTAALAGLVLIPLASAWGPALRVPVFTEAPPMVAAQSYPLALEAPEGTGAPLQADLPASLPVVAEATESRAGIWGWASALLLVYGAGVCFFLGRLGMGLLYVSSLRRQVQEVKDERLLPALHEMRTRLGIRRPVGLGMSERVGSPLQIGVFSPMAILPARLMDRLDDQTFRAVAAHELAHVRRWDYLFHLLAMVVLAFHWFNPLAWLAVRRLHETGEHACDEWAVRLIGKYEVYARALLDVLGDMRGQRVRWGMGMAYQAEERLERIMAMKNEIPAGVGPWAGRAVVFVLLAGAVLLGCGVLSAEENVDLPGDGRKGLSSAGTTHTALFGGGKIAYFLQGSAEAHLINADGTAPDLLAHLQVGDRLAWSGNGKKVAFVNHTDGYDICVMPSDGSALTDAVKITNDSYVESDLSLSTDGKRMAFYRYDPKKAQVKEMGSREYVEDMGEVCVMDADGTHLVSLSERPEVKKLLPERHVLNHPAISPDGRRVAFTCLHLDESRSEILLVNTNNLDAHPLFKSSSPQHCGSASWSPEGTKIAFSDTKDIYLVNVDGTDLHQVTHRDTLLFLNNVAWSPDGTKLAMQGAFFKGEKEWKEHLGESNIWVMDVDGANLHQVTQENTAMMPAWVSMAE